VRIAGEAPKEPSMAVSRICLSQIRRHLAATKIVIFQRYSCLYPMYPVFERTLQAHIAIHP